MITDKISWIEVTWTLIASIGLIVTFVNLREVVADLTAARTINPRNGRYTLALANVRSELWTVMLQSGFISIGVCSMALPNQALDHPARTVAGIILIVLGLGSTAMTICDALVRRALVRPIRPTVAPPDEDLPVAEHSHTLKSEPLRPTSSGPVTPEGDS